MLRRIGDQLVDDEAERNSEVGRYLDVDAFDRDGMSGTFIAQHSGQVIAKLLDEVLELDGLEVIEVMQQAADSPECPDALGRDHQLRGGFGALRLPTLQRQKADDQLKTVEEPMLEFLRQNFLRSQGLILLAQQRRAGERGLRLGGACGSPLLARSGRS